MGAKFKVGDRVRMTGRTPEFIRKKYRMRTRAIIYAFYDEKDQCMYYMLAGKGKGEMGYWCRSYMLELITPEQVHKIGRPIGKKLPLKPPKGRQQGRRMKQSPTIVNDGKAVFEANDKAQGLIISRVE